MEEYKEEIGEKINYDHFGSKEISEQYVQRDEILLNFIKNNPLI
ncbi:hypothetical protein PQ460_10580 [Paenibacillus sp. KACC 21273]|nr:hypothetical protein [Paenibacillus sp. KACC 21273]WDF52829.1 hypothetical protein PQ460_10580 [Paenibacillus sp. KACC 21273]